MSAERFVHYIINIQDVDIQHRQIFDKMDEIIISYELSNLADCVTKLHELIQQFKEHIITEDKLMKLYNYPYITPHREDHSKMGNILEVVSFENINNSFIGAMNVRMLEEMLVKHVDIRYSDGKMD